jgi:hypothetical protein
MRRAVSKNRITSKDRILAVIKHQPVDHIPLCFEGVGHPWVAFLVKQYPDPLKRAEFMLDLGLDTGVVLQPPRFSLEDFEINEQATRPYPDMEVDSAVFMQPGKGLDPGYRIKEWIEQLSGEEHPLLCKEYITPKGNLRQVVRHHEYPYHSVSLTNDLNIPGSRSKEHLVKQEEDLDKLKYILQPPMREQLTLYYEKMKEAHKFCNIKGVILAGRTQGIGDMLFWLSGPQMVIYMAMDNPEALHRYIDVVSRWNMARLEIQIDAGVDLIIRRGWYEGCDFWSPTLYREFLFQPLKAEIDLLHQAGVYLSYVMNSGTAPLLSMFRELHFDILSNIDPLVSGTDVEIIKRYIGDQIALYGGVNNFMVIEQSPPESVRRATFEAVEKLGKGGGYILGPGDTLDCLLAYRENTERSFYTMIEAWKECR